MDTKENEMSELPFVLFIKFERPERKKYHIHEEKGESCPPMARGDGCYGDCSDCYHRDRDRFERIAKFQKEEDKKNRGNSVVF